MLKRVFDIIMGMILLLFFLPIIVILAMLVRIILGTPIFFRQVRPGLDGKPFEMVKFRTMTEERCSNDNLLPDAERLTSFGRWLRKTSLDELPEITNVIKGDMSLVGPRPLLMEYLPLYNAEQARRHNVRPGITGWAQINGRNNLDWPARLTMDVWYVDNQSFLLDLKILLQTLFKIFDSTGINSPGGIGTNKFEGDQ